MIIQELTTSECLSAVSKARLGRLACAHENQPYVVPIYFVYEDPFLYGFTTPGLKVEWMRSNPLVCVEIEAVENREQWTSIVVFGTYEELPGTPQGGRVHLQTHEPPREGQLQLQVPEPPRPTAQPRWTSRGDRERLHAHELLQRYAEWWEPGGASCILRDPNQPLTPVFYRIRITRITGRRATPSRDGPVGKSTSLPARDRQGWLRKLLHALSKSFASRSGVEKYG
jgi:uncharacterized protein